MQLTPQQTNELLEIISKNQAIFIGKELGEEFLTKNDKSLLEASGINWKSLYVPEDDSIYSSFHLGMLAQSLNDVSAMNKLTFNDLREYIKEGKYIPITNLEQKTIDSIKTQTYADVKRYSGNIFQDVNGILQNTGKTQEELIREEIEEGVRKKQTVREIANKLHEKTGDWSRNFERVVEYNCNSAYQQGRAAMIEKDFGPDAVVYKLVQSTACQHCLRLYTTNGYGSEPKLFKLSELRANGTNIGRKTSEWKAIIDTTHLFCRCILMAKQTQNKWEKKTQSFSGERDENAKPILKKPRNKIRVVIAGKEAFV